MDNDFTFGEWMGVGVMVLVLSLVGYAILNLAAKNDKVNASSSEAYQKCVVEEYGVTVDEFYGVKGFYPTCDEN